MEAETMEIVSEEVVKKTPGQLFKEKHGYSRTQAKLMVKHKTDLAGLKKLRKQRRKELAKIKKEKHSIALAKRGTKSGSTGKKR